MIYLLTSLHQRLTCMLTTQRWLPARTIVRLEDTLAKHFNCWNRRMGSFQQTTRKLMKVKPRLYLSLANVFPPKNQWWNDLNNSFRGTELELVSSVKLLGLEIDSELSLTSGHVDKVCNQLAQRIGIYKKIHLACLWNKGYCIIIPW